MFVHHSAGNECFTQDDCMAEVRAIQNYHMDGNGWCDIGYRYFKVILTKHFCYFALIYFYSFLIGGDGLVYEGRGWNKVGAHTYSFNDVGYGIDFIGNFMDHNPTDAAQNAYFALAAVRNFFVSQFSLVYFTLFKQCAESLGHIPSNYECKGHRQASATLCPGDMFYNLISSQPYPHWVKKLTRMNFLLLKPHISLSRLMARLLILGTLRMSMTIAIPRTFPIFSWKIELQHCVFKGKNIRVNKNG